MDETFWKKIRFAMIFVLLASLLLLVLVKLIRPIPFIEGSEVMKDIQSREDVYKENKDAKYIFGLQSARVLRIYFEARESFNKIQTNNKKLKSNLDECKANI